MGLVGPAATLVPRAAAAGVPMLFTGHLPKGSPGELLVGSGAADWLRLPTHPTLSDNVALAEGCGAPLVLGHSCDAAALDALHRRLPALLPERTGARLRV